jgi:cysteine desulfurase
MSTNNLSYYFDENATASPLSSAIEAMYACLQQGPVNASSVHTQGRKGRGIIETCRRMVAQSLSVNSRHLTFCSGATEGLHTLIASFAHTNGHMVVSAVEHPAIWGALTLYGIDYTEVSPDELGCINPQDFTNALQDNTVLAIMMYAQNEIGIVYPITEIAASIGKVPLLVDAVQAWGKVPIKLEDSGASFAVVSGHKIGAAQGSGVLWSKGGNPFQPLLQGGAQERGRRAGTENVASLASLSVAAEYIPKRLAQMSHVQHLRDQLQSMIISQIDHSMIHANLPTYEGLSLVNEDNSSKQNNSNYRQLHRRLPNTLSVAFSDVPGDLLLQALDLRRIYLSSGSACSSGALEPSATLLALGISISIARNTLRISLGPQHQLSEIEHLFNTLYEEIQYIRT